MARRKTQKGFFELPPGNSNGQQGSASVPAAITLRGARWCAFEQCRLTSLGTFAFELMAGCSENRFVGNEIANIAAGGFRVNGGTERNPVWERTRNSQITGDQHVRLRLEPVFQPGAKAGPGEVWDQHLG